MILTYKYRIKDRRARRTLVAYATSVNQVWNWCAGEQRHARRKYQAGSMSKRPAAFAALRSSLNGVGAELGLSQKTVGDVCDHFVRARRLRPRCYLKFRRSKGAQRSLGWVPFQKQARSVSGNAVTYCGRTFRFWEGGRPLPVSAGGGCFVEDARGRWYVCFQVEIAAAQPNDCGGAVGIDLGLKVIATTSDGEVFSNPRHFARFADRLAGAQRSRKKRRVAALHARIRNARADWLHKVSARLAAENRLIVVGDISPRKLAKTRMAKSVLDAGWGALKHQLRYKASRHGAEFIEVSERFTTQTCSSCGSLPPERPRGIAGLGIRAWDCSSCGASHDRDVNAAKNILALGLGAQPPVEGSRNNTRIDTEKST